MGSIQCKKCKTVLPAGFAFCPACGRATKDTPVSNRRRKKGNGSVYKLSGNRSNPWIAKLCGKIIGYFPDRAAAEHFLATHKGADPAMIALTVKQVYERVKQTQAFKSLADGSKKNIEYS